MGHEDLYYRCIAVRYIQLLLEMLCCFIVDMCDGNVVYGFPRAFTGCYLVLLLECILWFARYSQSDKVFYVVDFTEYLYHTSIADQSL